MELPGIPALHTSAAAAVWQRMWSELVRLVEETRQALGHHLRDAMLACHPADAEPPGHFGGELRIGRSRLRLDCSLEVAPAGADEPRFRRVFTADAPLVRIVVLRCRDDAPAVLECVVAIDPLAEVWCTTDPEVPAARLDDALALEIWVWGMLIDVAR